jgi:hypothetical protein
MSEESDVEMDEWGAIEPDADGPKKWEKKM